MGLVKMAPDGWAYYAQEIASGREDYFAREAPGRWIGAGADHMGLGGEVSAPGLERLFGSARHPVTDAVLGRGFGSGRSAVAGYALSFSPPKSVSVLWALGGEQAAAAVRAGHDAAVAAALSYLERHAAFTRRGKDGVFQADTHGLVGAAFVHRTSRALDPQLHTHVLVANKVQATADGKWLSVDGLELYASQKAAGMLYKAALRAELSARLKVAWGQVDANGIAEIVGVPEALIDHWSTRRRQVKAQAKVLIAEREQALGRQLSNLERSEAHQLAAYRTRGAKAAENHSTAELCASWRQEAEALGLGPRSWLGAVARPLVARRRGRPTPLLERARAFLEETSSTWSRAQAMEVLTTLVDYRRLPDAATTRRALERAAEALLGAPGVLELSAPNLVEALDPVRRRDGLPAHIHHGTVRYTTEATMAREAKVLEAAAAGREERLSVLDPSDLEARMAIAGLGDDQARALRRICLSGEAICAVTGPAGAGKTRMLAVAAGAFEAAGHRVLGLAPSAMAAAVLKSEAAMEADTLARFLVSGGSRPFEPAQDDVVVVDEATMARSSDLATLIDLVTHRGAKLVAIGDPAQLGAVGAGGLFRTLANDTRAEALWLPRRFAEAWEKEAVLGLRARDQRVVETYARHGRITRADPEQAAEEALALWAEARAEGKHVLLLASDHDTVDALNEAARAARVEASEVAPDWVRAKGQPVGLGDEVVTLHNDRRLRTTTGDWVRNGDCWTVVGHDRGSLRLLHGEGRGAVVLPAGYVAEHVSLAYALTVHKAQGQTVDRAVVVVDGRMTAEQLYVAMSRGRERNQAVVVCEAPDTGHGRFATPSAAEVLSRVLRRSGAEQSATDTLRAAFERAQDLRVLETLALEAERTLERLAGNVLSAEIAALEPTADVEGARRRLKEAERRAVDRATGDADRPYEQAPHDLYEVERVRAELDLLKVRQRQREQWLETHPEYVEAARSLGREPVTARAEGKQAGSAAADPEEAKKSVPGPPQEIVPALEYDDGAVLKPDYGHDRRTISRRRHRETEMNRNNGRRGRSR